jgi:hypothetical protein
MTDRGGVSLGCIEAETKRPKPVLEATGGAEAKSGKLEADVESPETP